jgi:ferritin-like metal-binding protein YciE
VATTTLQSTNPKETVFMAMTKPEQVFLLLLSNARHGTERAAKLYEEFSQFASETDIKETLQARAFVAKQTLATLDECFRIIGAQPIKQSGRLEEVFADDFRRELNEIQSPAAKALYILAKAVHLQNLRTAEYVALTAAADVTGHHNLGVLLESCLADHLAFVERTRRMIRNAVTERLSERIAA